ncbi:MAG TPA: nucleoside triphosphate pyrophosphohydrolase [Candidatus Nanoarchaeia archaeon]|nr:nucleoside triphosphate pyrophosphohydrolase [Candidatus Nanoarchaeia archaeon]
MALNILVHDKLPEILEQKGKKVKTHTAKEAEFRKKLREKLKEEVSEYLKDSSPEELVDIIEVVYQLAEIDGIGKAKLEKIRKLKAEYKGSFNERIILDEVN